MAIDDELDAIQKEYTESPTPPAFEILVRIIGAAFPGVRLVDSIRTYFSGKAAGERVAALLEGLVHTVQRIEGDLGKIECKIQLPEFLEAVLVGAEYAARSADRNKIEEFVAVLASPFSCAGEGVPWDEVAAYIRDLSQLTRADLLALNILYEVQEALVLEQQGPLDPHPFVRELPKLMLAVQESGMSREDFYSRCGRLSGFGLAIETQRIEARMGLGDHSFRITLRGKRLVSSLRHASTRL